MSDSKKTNCEVKSQCLQETLSRLLLDDVQHIEITFRCTSKLKSCRRRKRLLAQEKGKNYATSN